MSKHVEFKLLQGVTPKCPHENCKSELKLDSCKAFLSPELFDIMSERVKEASIPAEQRIYCPYPKCSSLFSKTELQRSKGSSNVVSEARECPKCGGIFCMNCKVPWHSNMTCSEFKRLDPCPYNEDKKLMSLATQNLWRQCPKCNHMVSLAAGCYHIYCSGSSEMDFTDAVTSFAIHVDQNGKTRKHHAHVLFGMKIISYMMMDKIGVKEGRVAV
ncbi:hypothetical protein BUALT_Bualt13G0080400 [Buddleja alternifolia]|uniref:RBR-type E3 ubiquitin transferase n=1 Tax=Buddleja alternifolia TaxID=168488 RepID=A0AAV6WLF6_9LAMI|nr:hypothetical protein BUALT_Bualt13G0080400 [Buddleja alternifolia]